MGLTGRVFLPLGGAQARASRQRFEWDSAQRLYCISVHAATHFQIRRCIRVAVRAHGITVALRVLTSSAAASTAPAGGAPPSCLRLMGRFRLLEAAPCNVMDSAQLFSYDGASRGLVSSADPGACVRYLPEAAGFAAWSCGGDAEAKAVFEPRGEAGGGFAAAFSAVKYCLVASKRAGEPECLAVALPR